MAEETPAQTGPQGEQQIPAAFDDREMRTTYANTYFINSTADEVVIDFCLNTNQLAPNPQAQGGQVLVIRRADRIVMNYGNAKRLASTLTQLVKRYEQQFGEINVQQGRK